MSPKDPKLSNPSSPISLFKTCRVFHQYVNCHFGWLHGNSIFPQTHCNSESDYESEFLLVTN